MRFFRKWYFKIYHLLKLLGVFILIIIPTIVKAEEYDTCYNNYLITENLSFAGGSTTYAAAMNGGNFLKIPIKAEETIYIRFFPKSNPTCSNTTECIQQGWLNQNGGTLGGLTGIIELDLQKFILKVTAPNSTAIDGFKIQVNRSKFMSSLSGTQLIYSKNKSDIESCNTTPEPPAPGDNVYSSFLTLYIDRINYLANGSIENPYLLSMIGIIIGFVVLELFLHIFHIKGGYKK